VRLPERLAKQIGDAKKLGDVQGLHSTRSACESLSEKATGLASLTENVLDAIADQDLEFQKKHEKVCLSAMASTDALVNCRSAVSVSRERLKTAGKVTAGLARRLDEATSEMAQLSKPIAEIESGIPHLEGTPLAQEPSVRELHSLLEQLEQIKVDTAATISAARAAADAQKADVWVGEIALRRDPKISAEAALAPLREPFEQVRASLADLTARRSSLFQRVEAAHVQFEAARGAASSYVSRSRLT
jgi:chromosome segregation ATPase